MTLDKQRELALRLEAVRQAERLQAALRLWEAGRAS